MIKLGIHLIVKKHDYAPEIFKKFFSKLIEFLSLSSNYFRIFRIIIRNVNIKIFFSYTISLLEYFFKILFFLKILHYSGDFL